MNQNHDGHDDYDDRLYGMGSQGKGISEWVLGAGFLLLAVLLFVIVMNLRAGEPKAAEPGPQYAEFPPTDGKWWIVITRVVDGDTVDFCWILKSQRRGRIRGINAPELHTEEGIAAKNFLADVTLFRIPIMAEFSGGEKYGGLLLDFPSKTKPSVAQELVDTGHAKWWDGKGPKP